MPVVAVYRPNSRSAVVSHGKGRDLVTAKISGIMEAIERYHAERILLPLKFGSLTDLVSTHSVVDATSLPEQEGARFSRTSRLYWIEGDDLLTHRRVWLPLEVVHLDLTVPAMRGGGLFPVRSTGLAAGFEIQEALCNSLCEVIERDAATLWFLSEGSSQAATRIDLATIDDEACQTLIEAIIAADLSVAVWHATSDIRVAAFICGVADCALESEHPLAIAWGFGCHPDRRIALLRALMEALQARVTMISATSEDVHEADFTGHHRHDAERWRNCMASGRGDVSYHTVPTQPFGNWADMADWILGRLAAAGILAAIVIDLTRPEYRIPVTRVVVPGLEDMWAAPTYLPGPRACTLVHSVR
jgi:ribosomal protein S12 methylthiotransferase accessory factor